MIARIPFITIRSSSMLFFLLFVRRSRDFFTRIFHRSQLSEIIFILFIYIILYILYLYLYIFFFLRYNVKI